MPEPTARPLPSATATPIPVARPLVELPAAPALTPQGHALIVEFEVGGRSGYNPHPEWPGGSSGVTVGIGYDLGYYSKSVIASDWKALPATSVAQLLTVQGKTDGRAHAALSQVRDIYVQWQLANGVFDNVDVAREFANARHAYRGFDDLRPNAQAAIISLDFNRGCSFAGINRTEMRDIRDRGVPNQDYDRIASQLRKMVRVWAEDFYRSRDAPPQICRSATL